MRFSVASRSALRNRLLAAEVGPQDLRDRDATVRALVVLEDRHEAASRRHRGRVQRMRDELVTADLARADVQPPRLVIGAVAAADHFAVLLLARVPRLDVILLRRDRADVSRAHVHDAVRDLEGAVDRLAVRPALLVPRPAVLGTAEDELFDLVELVHPEQALRVDTV